jgi:hypothetical protein
MTTEATPPPLNTSAQHHLRRLTVGPPFWCPSATSSLPGTPPVAPSRSPAEPYRWLTATKPPMSVPPRRPTCELRAVTTPWARPARARYRAAGRLVDWIGPPGHGPASLSADRAWQATMPRGL